MKHVRGRTLLAHVVARLRRVTLADDIVIAIPAIPASEPITAEGRRLRVAVTEGPEHDVLARYAAAARATKAETVVRITSDCPLIDPGVVDKCIHQFHAEECDYLSNALEKGFPLGLACEVFSSKALFEAEQEAREDYEREHVSPFIHMRPQRYRIQHLRSPVDLSQHRWTVDTPEDLELIGRIIEGLPMEPDQATIDDILDLLAKHPDWSAINSHIPQKTLP